jgi:hypothetical protein
MFSHCLLCSGFVTERARQCDPKDIGKEANRQYVSCMHATSLQESWGLRQDSRTIMTETRHERLVETRTFTRHILVVAPYIGKTVFFIVSF